MGVLSGLKPERVFYYFEEITKIPHGSGNVEQISDYLADFARARNLPVLQDDLKNVIIWKAASPGYEEEPVLILQGHMDMVAVKKPECAIDLQREGLRIGIRGDDICAEGTSLGGDDGIAIAYALAILESETLKHPALEVVLTVDEEVGMDGARGIDLSGLKGSRLLNLDSEEEGVFLTSCAGGGRVVCELSARKREAEGIALSLKVGGLLGGHSGEEIHRGRGNSNLLFGRILYILCSRYPLCLVNVEGGLADNAIPRETCGSILIPVGKVGEGEPKERIAAEIGELLEQTQREIAAELGGRDPEFWIKWETEDRVRRMDALDEEDTRRAASFLQALPNGVQEMSAQLPGLVETSLNLGILRMEALESQDARIIAEYSVRSSVESAKRNLIEKLRAVTGLAKGVVTVQGLYPGWRYRADSPLRAKMVRVYQRLYGREPKVEAIHAGLECGLFADKIRDLDCVSIGPDMKNIHTTEETLSISSTARVWEFLTEFLAEKEES